MRFQNIHTVLAALFVFALGLGWSSCHSPRKVEASEPFAVMSFNIRYGTANDGLNAWPLRRELLLDTIANAAPQILGVQEALAFQLDEMQDRFPTYERTGVGRDDGVAAGEFSAILYDRAHFRVVEDGTFWLSATPEIVASTSWGNRIPRITSWAEFERISDGKRFHVFNTHFDHESQPSRLESARLIMSRALARAGTGPVIVMGDFNAGERNPAFRALVTDDRTSLRDSFRALHPAATDVGTFNGFRGDSTGEKIDAILISGHWKLHAASINRHGSGERWPSDHFPVEAELRL